jgi:HEXXH motif-containing protein
MTRLFHSVPKEVFDQLGDGGGGSVAVRILASGQYSKHLYLLRGVLDETLKTGHEGAASAQAGYQLLTGVQRHDPAAAHAVISYPSVGAWALRTLRALRGGPTMAGAEPNGLTAVAAAAAIRAGFPAEIEVPSVGGLVVLPSLGAVAVDSSVAVVRESPDGAEVVGPSAATKVPDDPHQDALGWLAARQLRTGAFDVLVDDVDPFRMPAESVVTGHLTTSDFESWDALMRQGWSLLARYHPDAAGELAAVIRTIVPLATPSEGQISSSSVENFGAVALSHPPDARTFAVTLVHEVQHLKLSALSDIVTMTNPDDGRRFYAPWRDDPRPASGLLQGAYAYLGVSRFWLRQRQLDQGDAALRAHAEFARWRGAAMGAVQTLQASGLLTIYGTDFVDRMARALHAWQDEVVPHEAQALADSETEEHLARWQSANGPISACFLF